MGGAPEGATEKTRKAEIWLLTKVTYDTILIGGGGKLVFPLTYHSVIKSE